MCAISNYGVMLHEILYFPSEYLNHSDQDFNLSLEEKCEVEECLENIGDEKVTVGARSTS